MQALGQHRERKSSLLVLASPMFVAFLTACASALVLSTEAVFAFPVFVIIAYVSFLVFVLPSIALLRKVVPLTRLGFANSVAIAATLPWILLYLVFYSAPGSAKYGGAPEYILLALTPLLLASLLIAYLIYPHLSPKGTPSDACSANS
jgi:hypothetical protein